MDYHISASVGFTEKNTFIGDYWSEIDKKVGFNYRIFLDGYFNDYVGVGIEMCAQHLFGLDNMTEESNENSIILFPYLLAELPLSSKFSLLAQVGIGSIVPDLTRASNYKGIIERHTLNYGLRLKTDITTNIQIGILYNEILESGVLGVYDSFKYFLYRSYSLFIGYDL